MSKDLKFSIDISDTLDEYLISSKQAQQMVQKTLHSVANLFMAKWKAEAGRALKSTRSEYINGIRKIERNKNTIAIVLTGKLNNMMELGASPFDIKAGFMNSSKVKRKVDGGWYLTIPFRYASPDSLGENSAFSGVLSRDIIDILNAYTPTQTSLEGNKKSGKAISLKDLPADLRTHTKREEIIDVDFGEEYISKSAEFEGLQKQTKTYETATQGSFVKFRRASDKSSPNSWIHKGFKAYNLAERAWSPQDFEVVVNNTVNKFLSTL